MMTNLSVYVGTSFAVGLGIGYLLRRNCFLLASFMGKQSKHKVSETNVPKIETKNESLEIFSNDGDYKLVLVVRNDLKMGKGKAAAQCSHATLGCYKKALRQAPKVLYEWESIGQAKVVVKCETEEELLRIQKQADANGLVTCIIRDAGRTQISSGSKTVLGVGPGPVELIDKVTGHLKLY